MLPPGQNTNNTEASMYLSAYFLTYTKPASTYPALKVDLAIKEPKPVLIRLELSKLRDRFSLLPNYSLWLFTVRAIVGSHLTWLRLQHPSSATYPQFVSPLLGLSSRNLTADNLEPLRYVILTIILDNRVVKDLRLCCGAAVQIPQLFLFFLIFFSLEDDPQFLLLQQLTSAVIWAGRRGFQQKILLVLLVRNAQFFFSILLR